MNVRTRIERLTNDTTPEWAAANTTLRLTAILRIGASRTRGDYDSPRFLHGSSGRATPPHHIRHALHHHSSAMLSSSTVCVPRLSGL